MFVAIPFRQTEKVGMTQPLLDYLSSHAEDYPHPPINEQVIEDLRALDTLRNQLIHVKKTVVSVDTPFLKYLAWLDPLGLKFPIYDDFIPMHFGWHAAMGSRREEKDEEEEGVDVGFTRHPHLQWEKASMVFNVGAWYSVLGCACTLDSEMEIKQACEYFQRAAGVFEYLKDQVTMNVFEEGIDFQPKCGSIFIHLMLAQSTETTWLMALTKGTLKDSSLSKLAAEISAAYFKLAMNVESFPEKSHSPILQQWQGIFESKHAYYALQAEHSMVQVLLATHQYGEAIARCQKAVSWLSLITHVPSSTWKTLHQTITTQLNQTQKENDLIYLQPVPTTFPSIPSSFLSLTPLPFIYPSTSSSTFLPSLFLTSLPTYLASCIYHVTQRVTQAMTYLATLQASPTFLEKLSTFTGYTTYETQWTEVDQRKEHVQRQLHQLLATSTSLNDPVTSHLLPWIQEVQLKHTVVSKNLPLLLEQLQAKQPVAKWLENMQDVLHRLDSLPSHCDHQTLECITLVTHQASVTQMTHFFNQVVHPCFSTPYFLHFDVPKLLVELNEFQELQNKFTRSHEFYLTLMKTLDGYTPLTPDAVQPSTPNTQPLLTPSTSTTPESVFQLGQWNANQQPLHFKKGGKGLE